MSEGVVKLVELELDLLIEELKEKDCGAGVSNVENLKKLIPGFCNIKIKTKKTFCFQQHNKLNPKYHHVPLIQIQFYGGWGRSSNTLERWT